MKKGDRVKIKENGKYSGQDMRWTEPVTKRIVTTEAMKVYHYSDSKLIEFCEKETCFYSQRAAHTEGFVYELEIPSNTMIEYHGDEEIRLVLTEKMEIRYIGRIEKIRDYTEKGRPGNPFVTIKDMTIGGRGTVIIGCREN